MHEGHDLSPRTRECLDEGFLADPFGDLCAALINFHDTAKLTGWDSRRIMGFSTNSAVELRLENIERGIVASTILHFSQFVPLGELTLE
jgi:hypothetical protein